jgi:hypothetical protein
MRANVLPIEESVSLGAVIDERGSPQVPQVHCQKIHAAQVQGTQKRIVEATHGEYRFIPAVVEEVIELLIDGHRRY